MYKRQGEGSEKSGKNAAKKRRNCRRVGGEEKEKEHFAAKKEGERERGVRSQEKTPPKKEGTAEE